MKKNNSIKSLKPLAILTTVGINMILYPVVMMFIGIKLNEWFSTGNFLTIILMLFGIIAGFRMMIRTIKGAAND
jgi:F0F1-type ATP synthase assembly protein I